MHSRRAQARTCKKPREHEQEPRKPTTQKTPRCTQVRGLREEVKPLLLPFLSQYISVVLEYKVLLELYDAAQVRALDGR